MTQEECAEVRLRRDQLTAQLNAVENTEENVEVRKAIGAQIEACNQELITNTYNPPQVAQPVAG